MKAQTIREQTLEALFQAEKAGRITGAERRLVTRFRDETDSYAESTYMKVRDGYMERMAQANEIMKRLY